MTDIENMKKLITLSNVWYGTQLATLFFSFLTFTTSFYRAYTLSYFFISTSLIISLYQSLTATTKKSDSPLSSSTSTSKESASTTSKPVVKDTKEQVIEFITSLKPLIKPAKSHSTTPYIFLSLSYLFILPRSALTLFPFVIFSLFHVLNYTRTFVVPKLNINANVQIQIKNVLEFVSTKYSQIGYGWAVQFQLASLLISIIWTLFNFPLNLIGYGDGKNFLNILTVIVWVSFISIVQQQNLLMKSTINKVITLIDGVTSDPRVPIGVRDAWIKGKHIIKYKTLNQTN